MGRLVLVLGGARSGKSWVAEMMAKQTGGRVTFIATAEARDDEMRRRIERHKAERPAGWRTVEEPLALAEAVEGAAPESDLVLVDCLTLWVSNRLCQVDLDVTAEARREVEARLTRDLEETASRLVNVARSTTATLLLVSNEVGLGLVPDNVLGRVYRDLLGILNRTLAADADQVLLMVAGIPVDVKRLAAEIDR